ncbi:MAG: hypothetical protein JWQ62_2892 [Lacunisphaera sp.]|nr:hypothetical protein [Lacunisphaera sp.]
MSLKGLAGTWSVLTGRRRSPLAIRGRVRGWSARLVRAVTHRLLGAGVLGLLLASPLSAQLYWRTDGTTGTTWAGTGWNSGSATATGGTGWTSGSNAVFSANSTLSFVDGTNFGDVTVTNGLAVTVTAAGTATAGAHTLDIGLGSALTWSAQAFAASGTSFVKNGAGTLTLGAIASAYDGGFTLNAGTVVVSGNNNALGVGRLTINGGTITSTTVRSYTPTAITVGGDFTLSGSANLTFAAPVDLGAAIRTITNNRSATLGTTTFSGGFSGSTGAGLIFASTTGARTQLTSTSTYDGGTTITGGIVIFNGANNLGTGSVTINGGTLQWASGSTADISAISLVMGSSGGTLTTDVFGTNTTLATAVTGSGALIKRGGGTLTLTAANSFVGVTIALGRVNLSGSGTLGNTSGALSLASSTLDLGSTTQTVGAVSLANSTIMGTGTLIGSSYNFVNGSILANLAGSGALTKTGGSLLELFNPNTFTGATMVTAGTIQIDNNLALQNSALNTAGAGVVSLSSVTTPTFGGLSGSTALASVITSGYGGVTALTLNPGTGSSGTYSGVIADGAAGMTLTKTGAGTQILSGDNTYSGGTTVSSGTLTLGSVTSLQGATGTLAVSGGTLETSVSSTAIGGNLTFSSGTIAPNGTGAGSLTLAAGKTFAMSGGTLNLTLGSSFDQIISAGSGTLALTGGTIDFGTSGAGFSYASSYQIFSGFGSASYGSLTLGGYDTAGYSAAISNAGLLTFSAAAIPEPSTYAALAGALALGFAAWRRRLSRREVTKTAGLV